MPTLIDYCEKKTDTIDYVRPHLVIFMRSIRIFGPVWSLTAAQEGFFTATASDGLA